MVENAREFEIQNMCRFIYMYVSSSGILNQPLQNKDLILRREVERDNRSGPFIVVVFNFTLAQLLITWIFLLHCQ